MYIANITKQPRISPYDLFTSIYSKKNKALLTLPLNNSYNLKLSSKLLSLNTLNPIFKPTGSLVLEDPLNLLFKYRSSSIYDLQGSSVCLWGFGLLAKQSQSFFFNTLSDSLSQLSYSLRELGYRHPNPLSVTYFKGTSIYKLLRINIAQISVSAKVYSNLESMNSNLHLRNIPDKELKALKLRPHCHLFTTAR